MRTQLSIWRIFLPLCIGLALCLSLVGCTDIKPAANQVVVNGKEVVDMKTTFEGSPTSYTRRGNDAFSVGYYVKDGTVIGQNSLLADNDAPVSELDLGVDANGEAFNAVIATGKGTDLTVTGSITATDSGNGTNASDFSGLGTQFLVTDYAKVHVDNMKIETKGFARNAFVPDTHGQILVTNSDVMVLGANPLTQTYEGYKNSADQNIMVSPPWVLGIMGGARAACMLGDNSTLSVVDSKVTSGGWGVLSTDAGNNFMMNVVDSDLTILPESQGGMTSGKYSYSANYGSGYGTYLIGNATENFYGVTYNGTTYALIASGGAATYQSSNGQIKLIDGDGNEIETVAGKGRPTTINSVFGFYGQGSGTVKVLDGTVVNAEDAVILDRAGSLTFIADNAVMNSKSGILLQMIDNDDRTVGGSMEGFNTEFNEAAGWPSENGNVTAPGAASSGSGRQGGPGGREGGPGGMPGGEAGGAPAAREGGPGGAGGRAGGPGGPGERGGAMPEGGMPGGRGEGGPGGMGTSSGVKLILTNGDYKGNVYNGSGYWSQSGNELEVSVEEGATLTGAVSLTETRHVDETGKQNTHFTINEYYYLGHVANRNYRNETAKVSVVLKDGGIWNVTGEGLISSLQMDGGTVENAKMSIDGKVTPIEDGKTYSGDIVISPAQ